MKVIRIKSVFIVLYFTSKKNTFGLFIIFQRTISFAALFVALFAALFVALFAALFVALFVTLFADLFAAAFAFFCTTHFSQ